MQQFIYQLKNVNWTQGIKMSKEKRVIPRSQWFCVLAQEFEIVIPHYVYADSVCKVCYI